MVTVPGRVEARMTVPVGGAAFSASNGAQTSQQALTLPAANYFFNAAGGVSGLLATLQSFLNDNVQGYPTVAAAMQAALGFGGDWTGGLGWLCNEPSGNLAPTFGATTLTATSLVYGTVGPRAGIDKAISFDAGTDNADGGAILDVGANDLIVVGVAKFTSAPSAVRTAVSKVAAAIASGWAVYSESTLYGLTFVDDGGQKSAVITAPGGCLVGEYHVFIAVIDRSTGKARFGTRGLTSGTQTLSGETTLSGNVTTAANFRIGASAWANVDTNLQIAAAYAVTGASAATGLSANLGSALTNFANAINSSFTVALGSDGRVTISNSFWPSSVAFTNTTLRDVLGFEYDFDYPQTAAQLQAVVGGTWASGKGWLLNEPSGNLAAVFGSTALTATSLLYSLLGARGGTDKSIGFDAGSDNASGGDIMDVTATDDLIILWVGRLSAALGATFAHITKYNGVGAGWGIKIDAAGFALQGVNGGGGTDFTAGSVSAHVGTFHVGMAVIDRSTGKARIATQSLQTGTQSVSAEASPSAISFANAANFKIGQRDDAAQNAAAEMSSCVLYAVSGAGVATGLSAGIATALSNFATYMKSQTSTMHARGVWEPDCTLDLEGDPKRAPLVTDARSTMSPTGQVITYVGNTFKRQRSILWSLVPAPQVWDGEAPYENGSWEEFLIETQFGLGSSWFKPGSLVQIYDHSGVRVGVDADVAGWSIVGINSIEPPKAVPGYTGLWSIEIPRLIAVGS